MRREPESGPAAAGRWLTWCGAFLLLYLGFALSGGVAHADAKRISERFEFQGLPVEFDRPIKDPVGVIYVFHGRGGGVGFLSRAVTQRTLAPLREAGFAVAGTESWLREPRSQWNIRDRKLASNGDLQRLLGLHAEFKNRGWIPAETPVFTLGMSNGAFMAMLFAAIAYEQDVDVRAVVAVQGGFGATVLDEIGYDRPTFYVLVANELLVNNTLVASGCDHLRARSKRCELRMLEEQPLVPALLVQYGFDPEEADQIPSLLIRQGWVDADGRRAVPVNRYEAPQDWVAALSETGVSAPDALFDALRHAWALHMMRDDYRDEQLGFLLEQLSAE
jgi:hypothetical protein